METSQDDRVTGCFGMDGAIRYLSANAQELLGVAPGLLVGRPAEHFFDKADMAGINNARDRLVSGEKKAAVIVNPRGRRGERRAMRGEFTAVFDVTSGSPYAFHFSLAPKGA